MAAQGTGASGTVGVGPFYSQHAPAAANLMNMTADEYANAGGAPQAAYQNPENSMYADMSMYNARGVGGGFQQAQSAPMGPKV